MKFLWWGKAKAEKPKQQGLLIRFDYGRGQNTYTYTVPPGKNVWRFKQAKRFLKWYFCRPDSKSIFISGEDGDMMEWRREHIINIEILKNYKRKR